MIDEISAEQPVERAATLEDVRAEVPSPERLNAFVFSGFAGIALLVAVVGVAGVRAFSVGARTREFGVRRAVGSTPAAVGASGLGGRAPSGRSGSRPARWGLHARASGGAPLRPRGVARRLPALGAAAVIIGAAAVASLMPAARASRVDVGTGASLGVKVHASNHRPMLESRSVCGPASSSRSSWCCSDLSFRSSHPKRFSTE